MPPTIKNLTVLNILPDKKFNIKIRFPPQYIAFEILGVNLSIANALRRVFESEIPTKRFSLKEWQTNDAFMIPEFLNILLRTIPIAQNIPLDKTFTIYKRATTHDDIIITTADIKDAEKYVNQDFPIATLCGKDKNAPILDKNKDFVEFSGKLTVIENTGYLDNNHNQCDAGSAVLQPVNAPPKNYGGEQSTMSAPTHFYIKAVSRGGIEPRQLFKMAITTLITRLRNAEEAAKTFFQDRENADIYTTTIQNENCTIAELIFNEVHEMDPDSELFTYDHRKEPRNIIFRSRSSDMDVVIRNAVNSIIKKLNIIEDALIKVGEADDCFGALELKAVLNKKFSHLPLIGESAEIAKKKTNNPSITGGWIHL